MGTWGVGLYASDSATDLRAMITSVVRLPLDVDTVVATIVEHEPTLADPRDPDHADCWFVLADRLHRYGLVHEPTLALVRHLIDDGADLKAKEGLGMTASDLRGRQRVLATLRDRLDSPHPKPYRTGSITKPEGFVLDVGQVLAYPTMRGESVNPYLTGKLAERFSFTPDGYRAAVVVGRGLAFGYLAWYSVTPLLTIWSTVPDVTSCLGAPTGRQGYGTLSTAHQRRMLISAVGTVDTGSLSTEPTRGTHAAIHDISISNAIGLSLGPSRFRPRPGPTLGRLLGTSTR